MMTKFRSKFPSASYRCNAYFLMDKIDTLNRLLGAFNECIILLQSESLQEHTMVVPDTSPTLSY
jgi:hypothetical protein